ncbi:hypothetical protein NDU88_008393 [Pleurodeles waltl]|uniref:Uncharacterized protein n=1 Tax=Pleurodeles waltl TaxID=8319 RepID=A0AAV7PS02_PLEWA|nr:hypothetical protein NDU88_008393 [Pleurodeles waltl]
MLRLAKYGEIRSGRYAPENLRESRPPSRSGQQNLRVFMSRCVPGTTFSYPTPGTKKVEWERTHQDTRKCSLSKNRFIRRKRGTHDSRSTTIRSKGLTPTESLQNLEHGLSGQAAWIENTKLKGNNTRDRER